MSYLWVAGSYAQIFGWWLVVASKLQLVMVVAVFFPSI